MAVLVANLELVNARASSDAGEVAPRRPWCEQHGDVQVCALARARPSGGCSRPMTALATIGLAPPHTSHSVVRRPRLVSALCKNGDADVAVLIAPAGYGKTTLLCEWAARDPRPFAWVALDARDNEPLRLLGRIARATDAAREEAASEDGAFVLVLDDVHVLHAAAALEVVAAIASDLPPEAMLAVASRTEPPLPIPRLRAQRALIELRAPDLALAPAEVATVLRRAGSDVDREALDRLTEGWPAAVSLALLAGEGFGGDEQLVTDYVTDELLDGLGAPAREFLRRTIVLDVLTGPACDAVLSRRGSAATLSELARGGVLLVALDRRGERFRHHRLLAATLRSELRRLEPELEPELHRRASAFHRRRSEIDGAVRHALAAGDARTASAIVWRHAATEVCHGRTATLDRWLERFTDR